MGDLVNLRQVRKAKVRAAKAETAEANRLEFGRTKGERGATDLARARAEARLDGHRRDEATDVPTREP